MICLGIEGTAEKTGVGIVEDENILSSSGNQLFPESGGIHPREAAEHHAKWIPKLISEACNKASVDLKDIDLISFSRGPGLGPALRTVATASRTLALSLNIPIVGANHCIGHIEIGKLDTGAKDPVSLYVSGGNSQVIAYEFGRYRVFGETLDIAIGNSLDQFGRKTGLSHPGGPIVEKLAKSGNYTDLPYSVKGMDFSFSGLLSAAIRKFQEGVAIEDICYSFQETAFSMLVEVTERALSHTKKDEVMICGGVAANKRLGEMLSVMADEHYANFYMPKMEYCGDNGAMIALLGLLTYNNFGEDELKNTNVISKYRTDEVDVPWVKKSNRKIKLPKELLAKGAEANICDSYWLGENAVVKSRIPKSYRIKEIDEKIRKSRTKKEAKLLSNVKRYGVVSPVIFDVDLEKKNILMEKINGVLVKDFIGDLEVNNRKSLCKAIGENIVRIHQGNITHGDLTSSNIMIKDINQFSKSKLNLLKENYNEAIMDEINNRLTFIDFGLGKFSDLIEDKSVDLLVLKKSFQSIDYKIADNLFKWVIEGYKNFTNEQKETNRIILKISEIQNRGRYIS